MKPPTLPELKTHVATLFVLVPLLGLTAGCDLSDENEELDVVLGSWRILDVVVDDVSFKEQLDAQYNRLVVTLREDADENEFFNIVGQPESGEVLNVRGSFDVDEDEITFFPEGPSVNMTPIELDFRRVDASTLRFSSEDDPRNEELFLELIQLQVQGNVDRLEVRLTMTDTSAEELTARAAPSQ